MSLGPRAALVGAVLLAGLVAVPVTTTGPAAAASPGRCERGTGVTVVVDYGPLGRGVEIGCDPDGADQPASQVVPAAGFPLAYVNGQGFVCRIDGLPNESQEQCSRTPPQDAYWALFWSDGDPATWRYSSEGVASLDVPEGGSIGWRFQDGGNQESPGAPPNQQGSPQPSSPPPSPAPSPPTNAQPSAPPASTPTPTQSASPRADTPAGAPSKDGSTTDKDDERVDARDGKRDKNVRARKRDRGDTLVVRSSPSPSPAVAALSPASDEPMAEDGSSTGLTLLAGSMVLLLAGAAGVIAWRRRV